MKYATQPKLITNSTCVMRLVSMPFDDTYLKLPSFELLIGTVYTSVFCAYSLLLWISENLVKQKMRRDLEN